MSGTVKFVVVALGLVAMLGAEAALAGLPTRPMSVLELAPGPDNPRNSEGDLITLKDGRVLLVYSHYTKGRGQDHDPAILTSRISADGGRTWSQTDRTVVDCEGGLNVMSVSLLRMRDGALGLFYLVKNSEADCRPVLRRSTDEGETWSAPIKCVPDAEVGYYVLNNGRAVRLKSGRIVLPMCLHASKDGKLSDMAGKLVCWLSDDDGQTWRRGAVPFATVDEKGKRVTTQEPGIVELKDGRALMYARTAHGRQWFYYSSDGCETWTKGEPGTLFGPCSPASVKRLRDGRLVAVWNDHEKYPAYAHEGPAWAAGLRKPFSIALSDDEGRTWKNRKTIEDLPDGWYCYSAILEMDGYLLIEHCAEKRLRHSRVTLVPLAWLEERTFSKDVYLDLMERAVGAYSAERAAAFTDRNERDGVREHGFPRLTANLGILIAHGRLVGRKDEFRRMMDICCRDVRRAMPKGTGGGNDFSVKELVFLLDELERAKTFPKDVTDAWRERISGAIAEEIYSCQPKLGDKTSHNWCVFGAASELARLRYGMGGSAAFADRFITDQLRFFDENGMYMDPHQPMVYDFVTRLQFAAALACGYDGASRARLEELMDKSALPTLRMQSISGEIPFGGRSNQFLHNETFYAALCEWYAARYRDRGDLALARRFRAAAERAVRSLDYWLKRTDVRHVKNRYPSETGYGCEGYAYFDKYMVTMGSWAYLAYRFADETITPAAEGEPDSTFVTSDPFHRIMVNVGDYTAEFDWNAQKGYDANGIGRFQRRGAPTIIGLAAPFPTKPHYRLDVTNDQPLAIGPLGWKGGKPVSAHDGEVVFRHGKSLWTSRLTATGLEMTLKGEGPQTLSVPVLLFDGERKTEVRTAEQTISVVFDGWRCDYRTDGKILDTGKVYGNRNGHYRRFDLTGQDSLTVQIGIDVNADGRRAN